MLLGQEGSIAERRIQWARTLGLSLFYPRPRHHTPLPGQNYTTDKRTKYRAARRHRLQSYLLLRKQTKLTHMAPTAATAASCPSCQTQPNKTPEQKSPNRGHGPNYSNYSLLSVLPNSTKQVTGTKISETGPWPQLQQLQPPVRPTKLDQTRHRNKNIRNGAGWGNPAHDILLAVTVCWGPSPDVCLARTCSSHLVRNHFLKLGFPNLELPLGRLTASLYGSHIIRRSSTSFEYMYDKSSCGLSVLTTCVFLEYLVGQRWGWGCTRTLANSY